MPHFKLTLAYDGTTFVGWQRQAVGESIQGLLEDALARLDQAPVVVAGAGRTDAGVHALGQVASVTLARDISGDTLRRALNAHLPPAIRVVEAAETNQPFHARFSATSKIYRYRIWNAEVLNPFERPFVWHLPAPALDVAAMDEAARVLEGTHDFSSFQGAGSMTKTAVRTLWSSRVERRPAAWLADWDARDVPSLVIYEVRGSGFLRHMVRNIVGTLVDVGRGRRESVAIGEVLRSRSRLCAGETAPASGLCLVSVAYELTDL